MQSIHIVDESLPLAWEKAVVACWQQGENFPTEYDRPGDPNSRDVTALIHVTRPFDEPRIHRAFPGGLEDLEKYKADGMVFGFYDFDRWLGGHHRLLAKIVEDKTGLPTFYIEGNSWDDRDYSAEALRTRIESICEIMKMRKG